MTDPGSFTIEEQEKERNIDLILITHEHQDHFHLNSIKKILLNNPHVLIVTNASVGDMLAEEGIEYVVLEDRVTKIILGIEIEAHDCKHEEIFEEIGQVENTAYFIDKRLFYPGDAFYNPGKPVEILALPVGGPWLRIKDFMKYALEIKPKICFPVHDGMLTSLGVTYRIPKTIFPKNGIIFKTFEEKKEEEF
jgi:L-ascorbate metabolism protein UlaG (beta-lactamase superfamily)